MITHFLKKKKSNSFVKLFRLFSLISLTMDFRSTKVEKYSDRFVRDP